MRADSNWLVRAAPLDFGSIQGRGEPDLGHWGCLGPILTLVLAAILALLPGVEFSLVLLLPASFPILGLIYLNRLWSLSELEDRYQDRIRQKRQSLEHEAARSGQSALRHLEAGQELTQVLNLHLKDADRALQAARDEFSSRAFAPFWDAVEAAAVAIGQYRDGLDDLAKRAEWYHKGLRDKEHTFPNWSSVVAPVDRPDRTLSAFRDIVRQGQTDFEFSNIFEHRRTRQVLIAGFEHLGNALSGLSQSVKSELDQHAKRLENLERRRD